MIWFFIGAMFGGVVGVAVICCMVAAKESDKDD